VRAPSTISGRGVSCVYLDYPEPHGLAATRCPQGEKGLVLLHKVHEGLGVLSRIGLEAHVDGTPQFTFGHLAHFVRARPVLARALAE
jgi:hypothetical protein